MRFALTRFAALFVLLLLTACGFEAPAPKRTPPPQPPPIPVSMVSATLTVPVGDILKILNARTQNQIADIRNQPVACVIATCALDLTASRTDEITGMAYGNALSLTAPIAVHAHMVVKGGFFRTSAQGQALGVAEATTRLQLAPDWQIKVFTQGTIKLSEGQLKLGPVKMNIAELWNHNAAHLAGMLFHAFDREIAGHVKSGPPRSGYGRNSKRRSVSAKDRKPGCCLSRSRFSWRNPQQITTTSCCRSHLPSGRISYLPIRRHKTHR
ncbi:MAG TPA: DUF4403 family protein, partial [Rhizomicrobium sp.]